ncbi:MAG: LCP family protein [Clostridia bacterium]|nr:LCP family protein [Clostridia bacterium]
MNVRTYLKVLLITLLIVSVMALGFIAYYIWTTNVWGAYAFKSGQHGDALDEIEGSRINTLVVGKDRVADNTDTILVMSADTSDSNIYIVSIPRDTKVSVNGRTMKINAVYSYAKYSGEAPEELLIDTVKEVTGIKINNYAIIDTKAFREIVDALDGVEYDVPRDYNYDDPYQDLHIHIKKGFQTLYGEDAEGLVRYRHDYARADLERVEVQQSFIKELIKQKLKAKYITKAPKVYRSAQENITSNFTVNELMEYARKLKDISDDTIHTFTIPGEARMINGASYFIIYEEETKEMVRKYFE